MFLLLQTAAQFRPTASAPAWRERRADGPLTGFIRTAVTRAPAGLCRRLVRHSGRAGWWAAKSVNAASARGAATSTLAGVGWKPPGARHEPETLCPGLNRRAFRFERRPNRARQMPLKPPRREPIGLSRPRIYSAQCLLTFQIRYFTVPFQCACHPCGRHGNHRQLLTNLSHPCPKQVSVLFCCRRKIFLLTTAR